MLDKPKVQEYNFREITTSFWKSVSETKRSERMKDLFKIKLFPAVVSLRRGGGAALFMLTALIFSACDPPDSSSSAPPRNFSISYPGVNNGTVSTVKGLDIGSNFKGFKPQLANLPSGYELNPYAIKDKAGKKTVAETKFEADTGLEFESDTGQITGKIKQTLKTDLEYQIVATAKRTGSKTLTAAFPIKIAKPTDAVPKRIYGLAYGKAEPIVKIKSTALSGSTLLNTLKPTAVYVGHATNKGVEAKVAPFTGMKFSSVDLKKTGLKLNASTGAITGTLANNAIPKKDYSIVVSNGTATPAYTGDATFKLSIEIKPGITALKSLSYGYSASKQLDLKSGEGLTTAQYDALKPTLTPPQNLGANGIAGIAFRIQKKPSSGSAYTGDKDSFNRETGLKFNTKTGAITGTPNKVVTATYRITVAGTGLYSGTKYHEIKFVIKAGPKTKITAFSYTATKANGVSLTNGTAMTNANLAALKPKVTPALSSNSGVTFTIQKLNGNNVATGTNNATTFNTDTGLTFNTSTGAITGTPNKVLAATNYRVTLVPGPKYEKATAATKLTHDFKLTIAKAKITAFSYSGGTTGNAIAKITAKATALAAANATDKAFLDKLIPAVTPAAALNAGSGVTFTIQKLNGNNVATGTNNATTFNTDTGLTFSTTTGAITGTPNKVFAATDYRVTLVPGAQL